MEYRPTIGLEIHIELNTKSKMFCGCKNDSEEKNPNTNVCPVCTAQPGTLPVINEEALKKVIKTGLALNCQIPEYSKFDRKNYFYPDLPKGYQISQLYNPLCKNGYLELKETEFPLGNSVSKRIRIREVHLEEDTGKLIHPESEDFSLVDFNRAGVPLMELVTEPDITSASQAKKFAEELHLIMHYLDVSDADMEKGEMRVEVNISLSGDNKLGTKTEIKNLNSFRSVERAVDYEIKRQSDLLDKGEKIIQETRGWLDEATASSHRVAGARVDDTKGMTFSQRKKEQAHDYRYFPEPDLPPLKHSKEFINEIRAEIPELPAHRRERFKREYELDEKSAEIFVYNKKLGEYFEKVAKELPLNLVKLASDFLINTETRDYNIPPKNFSQLIILIKNKKISNAVAKEILPELVSFNPSELIKKRGLEQVSDEKEIEKIAREVISQNQKVVEDYKKGKTNALQFLTGQIMAKTQGKANPQIVNALLKDILTKTK